LGLLTNEPVIDCSGILDMSCNSIVDVSRIFFFVLGPVTTGRTWIGTGSSFDIDCVETLKMIVPGGGPVDTSAVEIIVGTSAEMIIDSSHSHLRAGSLDTPAIHFGLVGANTDTGFYRIGNNSIGVAADGNLMASFWGVVASTGYKPNSFNVGAYGSATAPTHICGIYRHSKIKNIGWEDGHLGNSQMIYFTASDFMQSATQQVITGLTGASTSRLDVLPLASAGWGGGGQGGTVTNTSTVSDAPWTPFNLATTTPRTTMRVPLDYRIINEGGFGPPHGPILGVSDSANTVLFAQKVLPLGFEISGGDVATIYTNADIASTDLQVFLQDISSSGSHLASGLLDMSGSSYPTNGPSSPFVPSPPNGHNFSGVGTGNTVVIIQWAPGISMTSSNGLIGASVTMSRA